MEAFETQVDSLPEDLKSFITMNTAQQEKMIQCYLLKKNIFLSGVVLGVVALTNYNLLLKFNRNISFHRYSSQGSKWNYVGTDPEKWHIVRLSRIRKTDYNKEMKMVFVDFGAIDGTGGHIATGIELGDKAQTESFGNLLKKVLAEYSAAPIAVKGETSMPDVADHLMKLAELRKNNMITDEEYETAKRKLLA